MRYAYHKPFMVHFPDRYGWQYGFTPDIKGALNWYTDGCKTNKDTGAVVYRLGSKQKHNFSLGLHTTVFQAKIYIINAHGMENTEKCYSCRTLFFLTVKKPSRPLTNSKLVWECHQSVTKLAEHNRIKLALVLGHMGIDENEIADQLARRGSFHQLVGPKPAFGISTKVAKEIIRLDEWETSALAVHSWTKVG